MIEYVKGDFTLAPEGFVIVHGCNCQGKYNAGAAKAVRERFPSAYERYMADHSREALVLGRISAVEIPLASVLVVNAYTQFYYGRDGRRYTNYESVALAFERTLVLLGSGTLSQTYENGFAFPKLGCVLGGGNWEVVSAIIDTTIPDTFRKVCYELG
jgi:O-acetyl-ADP-ribose deacetylase (regulator of RNase III)